MNEDLKKILEKVSCLYRKFGIRSVTMDDVSRELGISKKTLYQYVADKGDLVDKVVEHVRDCNFSSMDKLKDSSCNAIEQLVKVSQKVNALMQDHSPSYEYDLKKYYPEIYARLMSEKRSMMYDSMIANIRQGKEEGLYREDVDEEIISKLQLIRMENMHSSEIFSEEELHTREFFREMFTYHIRGLATARGLEVLQANLDKLAI